ncbi:MAG: terminase large subunit [Dehalococcoidia bacterium]
MRRGCIRDFFRVLGESEDNNPRWSKTLFRYDFGLAKIEFFGADESDKVRGPRRDILFINEGNNVPWETARALDIRTSKFTIVDWNPVTEFWVHMYEAQGKKIPGWIQEADSAYIHSTYLDALKVLPKEVVQNIESNKGKDANWWNVYGLGLLGHLENLIWPDFQIVDELPPKCDWQAWGYGLDFGFVNPTALIKVILSNKKLYWDERVYQTGLTNADLIERLTHEDKADIYADSAEPDRIEEISRAGWTIYPANKDVKMGLDLVRRQPLHISKSSVDTIKEVRNYSRKKDKDGKVLEEPVKIRDHSCDAGRYGSLGLTERFGFATATPGQIMPVWQF